MVFIHTSVREDDDGRTIFVRLIHRDAQMLDRFLQAGSFVICDWHIFCHDIVNLRVTDLQKVRVRKDRIVDL